MNGNGGIMDLVHSDKSLKYSGSPSMCASVVDPHAVAVRYEYTNDKDNVIYGTGFSPEVLEVTVTGEHKISGNLLLHLEYPHDMPDKEIFTREEDALKKNHGHVAAGVVYSF